MTRQNIAGGKITHIIIYYTLSNIPVQAEIYSVDGNITRIINNFVIHYSFVTKNHR